MKDKMSAYDSPYFFDIPMESTSFHSIPYETRLWRERIIDMVNFSRQDVLDSIRKAEGLINANIDEEAETNRLHTSTEATTTRALTKTEADENEVLIAKENNENEVKIDSTIEKVNSLTNKVEVLQTNLSTLSNTVDTVKGEVTSVKANVNTVQSEVGTVKTNLTTVQGEIDNVKTDVATVKTNVAEHTSILNRIWNAVKNL